MAKKQDVLKDELDLDNMSEEELQDIIDDGLQEGLDDADEDLDEETEAARTLRANSKPADSKMQMMAGVSEVMSGMSKGDMVAFFQQVMAQAKDAAKDVPNDAAAKNKASIDAKSKPIKEDLAEIFGDDENLSEEFKQKTETLFEAAVTLRLNEEIARLEEAYEEKLEEELEESAEYMIEKLDLYLNHIAEEWLEENEVAIENSIKGNLTESLISDLQVLCNSYNINVEDEELQVAEELQAENEALKKRINESEDNNIALSEEIDSLIRANIIDELSEGLSVTKIEKFHQLAEGVEFGDDLDEYRNKLSVVRETFFAENKKPKPTTQLINEEIGFGDDNEKEHKISPQMKRYHDAISRTVPKK